MLFLLSMSNYASAFWCYANGRPLMGLACTAAGLILTGVDVYQGIQAYRYIRKAK